MGEVEQRIDDFAHDLSRTLCRTGIDEECASGNARMFADVFAGKRSLQGLEVFHAM